MTTRTVTVEALAMRNDARAKHAEQDALILQDDLIQAHQQIKQLTADLEAANVRITELEEIANGTPS